MIQAAHPDPQSNDRARRLAVFLDRDGVLNDLVLRDGAWVSPRTLEDFVIIEEAPAAVGRLRHLGVRVFVVTNQPDLARGHLDESTAIAMTAKLAESVQVDEIRICPHDDADECDCRKPRAGMLLDLARLFDIDLSRSFMVGDSWRDIEAGRRAGCVTILVAGRAPTTGPADHTVASLHDAVTVVEDILKPA